MRIVATACLSLCLFACDRSDVATTTQNAGTRDAVVWTRPDPPLLTRIRDPGRRHDADARRVVAALWHDGQLVFDASPVDAVPSYRTSVIASDHVDRVSDALAALGSVESQALRPPDTPFVSFEVHITDTATFGLSKADWGDRDDYLPSDPEERQRFVAIWTYLEDLVASLPRETSHPLSKVPDAESRFSRTFPGMLELAELKREQLERSDTPTP